MFRAAAGRRPVAIVVLLALLLLAGCAIGPKYVRPSVPIPAVYKETGAQNLWKTSQPDDGAIRGKWWEAFGDPELNALEEKVGISNQNIAAATANFVAARAIVSEARSQYFPSVTAGVSVTNSRFSTPNGVGVPVGTSFTDYSMPFAASWQPDLWGRVRSAVKANAAAAQVSAADLENVRLAATAEVAVDYYELRTQDTLIAILNSTVAAYQEALGLTQNMYTAGLETDEAVAQAEAQLEGTRAQDINLGIQRAQYEHAIALLAGQPASVFSIPAEILNVTPPAVPAGVPAGLLERRPDIAAAERAIAQANAQIGVAKAAFFPNVTLSASGGFSSLAAANWFTWPSRVWSLGPDLVETVFDAGLRKATVKQYQASYDQAVANYRQTVLTAFQQVEDGLASLRLLSQVIQEQDATVRSAARSLREANVRYESGLDPYLNVISAQTVLLNDEQAAANFRMQRLVASVQLIEALGGGWNASQLASAESPPR